jgi:hypothetical protein
MSMTMGIFLLLSPYSKLGLSAYIVSRHVQGGNHFCQRMWGNGLHYL